MRKTTLTALFLMLCVAVTTAQTRFTASVEKRVDELMSKMTLDEKLTLIGGDWMYTKGVPRLGIGQMKMSDGPQGLGTHGRSTAYPSAVLLAATWDRAGAYSYGTALARDCKAKGVNILLGPAVNIYRAPMDGRNFEYMGEDPFLTSNIAVGYIRGVQDHGVMGVVKHFAFNNSEYDRHHISNDPDERTMNEIYFPAFRAAIQQAEVGSVMSSYNLWNGIYTSECPYLMTDVLRKQWGFKGLVMSDWGAVHHCIPTARAGLDLEMPSATHMNADDMKYYLRTGDVTMEMIDSKVRHILRTQLAFGLDKGKGEPQPEREDPVCVKTALDIAREGIVLLKNSKGTLPINTRKVRRIVVTGANAEGYVRGGGSGYVSPMSYVSVYDGISKAAKAEGIDVEYVDPWELLSSIAFTDKNLKKPGFNATYYNGTKLEGTPIASRHESHVSYQWPGNGDFDGLPKNNFSVRWTAVLCSPKTMEYEFTVGGDDGYRVIIDGQTVTEDWKDGAFRKQTFKKTLEAGRKYDIAIELYQAGGSAAVDFFWNSPQGAVVPAVEKGKLAKADLVVAALGFNAMTEYEDADRTFALPGKDLALIGALRQAKRPVIGLINSGGGVEMQSWEPMMKGLLWLGYSGQEAGTAVADILFGKTCPSGRLPMTWEKRWADNPTHDSYYDQDGDKHVAYKEGVFVGYRGYDKLKREVQYPFGFGLSYTSFALSGMTVTGVKADGTADVVCTLKNTGRRKGAAVVQCYVGKNGTGAVERPVKELRGFEKVTLDPGQSKTVKMTLPKESFMYYDVKSHGFVPDKGAYNVMLGFSSRDIKTQKSLTF